MKYNKIILFFNIALIFGVIMRFFQIRYTVEYETGFFIQNYKGIGYFMLAAVFVIALVAAIFANTCHKSPEHPPKKGRALGIVSFLPAAAVLAEVFSESFSSAVSPVMLLLLKASGLLAAAYFVGFGLQKFVDFDIPPIASIIPCVYIIIRIICDFSNISTLALISDNIFLISAYCLSLLFFLNFTKLYNEVDNEYNFRKLLASGTAAVILCISQSVPSFVINLISGNGYTHISPAANFSLFAFGLFVMIFIFTHFSDENMK